MDENFYHSTFKVELNKSLRNFSISSHVCKHVKLFFLPYNEERTFMHSNYDYAVIFQ